MSREDVTDYLTERICDIVEKADIQYIKWDMNRSLMAAYSAKLPRDRQGELRHRYVLGLYKVLDAVAAVDGLMQVCCITVRRSGVAIIRMRLKDCVFSTVLPLAIRCLLFPHTYRFARIIRIIA